MGRGPFRIIGIVSHVRHWGLATDESGPTRDEIYAPFAQQPDGVMRLFSGLMSIAVRTSGSPLTTLETLKSAVRGITGDQVLYGVNTMEQLAGDSLAQQRFLLVLFGIFAALALLLACIGIYGVLAYLTSRRIPEIGVRMALGASAGNCMWMILRQSLCMILVGVGVGVAATLAAGRLLERSVDGMQPGGPSALAVTVPVLMLAALIASFVPARCASRVDPMRA